MTRIYEFDIGRLAMIGHLVDDFSHFRRDILL